MVHRTGIRSKGYRRSQTVGAQRVRHSTTEPVMSTTVELNTSPTIDADAASPGAPERAMSDQQESQKGSGTELVMARYVEQLETRIEEKNDVIGLLKGQLVAKDEQISELSTRYRETHSLLGAMQRMFAPLLGQADPYVTPEKREGHTVENSAKRNEGGGL